MFSRIHNRLGTAGFAIAIVALVAALAGTAWAALPGLNSKQKREVKKIAKQFAGAPGAPGAAGAAGPVGPTGPAGPAGKDGTNGTNGTNGKSVLTGNEATGTGNCEGRGGFWAEVEGSGVKRFACNGKNGEGGAGSATMTGDWSYTALGPAGVLVSISYPHKLAAEPTFNWVELGEAPTSNCPGSPENPEAEPGNLCFYALTHVSSGDPSGTFEGNTADKLSGATVEFSITPEQEGYGSGSWAVTEE